MQLEQIAAAVEDRLYECGEPEIRSAKIGNLVMELLAPVNEVAYVRFASVYRKFKDITSFEKELSNIKRQRVAQ